MTPAVLALKGVEVSYPGPPPVHALRGVSLTINDDSCLALVGPSGSGKSTLLNVMGLLERPTAGDVLVKGENVSGLRDRDLTRHRGNLIGFVFQQFHLLKERTCVENVQLGLAIRGVARRERRQRAEEALDAVGLSGRAQAATGELSGGEKQRVAIARALAGRPSLLLCDEPTGNLDSAATQVILSLLREQHERGVALVVVTHDPRVAEWADAEVALADGQIVRGGM